MILVADFDRRVAERETLGRLFIAHGGNILAADDAVCEFIGHELLHLV